MCWRAANALISYVTYLQRYFWPVGLVVCYPRLPLDLPTWEVWSSLAILLGVTAVAVAYRRGLPYLAVGWFWYLGMLIPTIGLLQVGTVAVADRFTYLPQIGLGIALAWSAADLCGWSSRRATAMGVVGSLIVLVLMACAWRQTSYWRNSETLWRRLACTSRNSVAHGNLGSAWPA